MSKIEVRKITKIFIHHSASNFGDVKLIEQWHKERGFSTIGYHFVVLNGYRNSKDYKEGKINQSEIGLIEKGLDTGKVGIHVAGHNTCSVGICLIHFDMAYTDKQLESYRSFTAQLAMVYGIKADDVLGHYEVDRKKPLCPSLNMDVERAIIKEMMR